MLVFGLWSHVPGMSRRPISEGGRGACVTPFLLFDMFVVNYTVDFSVFCLEKTFPTLLVSEISFNAFSESSPSLEWYPCTKDSCL